MSSALIELAWKTLVLGSSFPDDFDNGNWTSPPGESFPIDVLLGLHQMSNVYKVVVEVDDQKTPSRAVISVGETSGNLPVNYKNARKADFSEPVTVEFHKRERSESRMENRAAFTNSKGQYLWLQLHEATKNKRNTKKQIQINKVHIYGYPIDQPQHDPADTNELKLDEPVSSEQQESSQKRKRDPITRFSYNGDGMKTGDGGLSTDPLTCVRTVKRAIDRKKSAAKKAGRDVEATLSLRAVQRLTEYEDILEELASKRRKALAEGDMAEAERVKQTMEDCRDTALRSSHVDILLGEAELKAIGVTSEWSEEP